MQTLKALSLILLFFAVCPLSIATPQVAGAHTQIVGNVRVEALSPTLVRIELKGPEGFENRATFHVVNRNWPGVPLSRHDDDGFAVLSTPNWSVHVPERAAALAGITVEDSEGRTLYTAPASLSASEWLPAPGDHPKAWAVADSPRIVPPPWGAAPSPAGNTLNAKTSGWDTGNDSPDIYVFLPAGSYSQLRRDYLKLTGPTEMPPLYIFGLFNSRYHDYSQAEALATIARYRALQIPLDVMVLDTNWRKGGSSGYDADTTLFPNMPAYLAQVHAGGVHSMFNDHPQPQGSAALDPAEITYRYAGLSEWLTQGLDLWWYDRNWGVSLLNPVPGLRHEVWGMRLYHDMTATAKPGLRPVIMANVDGIDGGYRNHAPDMAAHRFPIQWTGDTQAQWPYLRRAVENAVYSGVHSLVPYMSDDLGGFSGTPTPSLYVRYLEYGSLSAVMRPHCNWGETRAPWAFGPEAQEIVTRYIRMRYRLLPYLYAAAHENYTTGQPLLRRLDLEYPGYPEATANDEYLLGPSVLVAPIVDGPEIKDVPTFWLSTPDGHPGLLGAYFKGENPTGTPAATRIDPTIDLSLGSSWPPAGIDHDHFSCVWTGTITNRADQSVRLQASADDGVRVSLDGKLVIDEWHPSDGSATYTAKPLLAPGQTYTLKIEYMQQGGQAMIRLGYATLQPTVPHRTVWIPPGTWTNAWNGRTLSGPRTVVANAPLAQMPIYIRAGSVIPLVPQIQYTGERPWDTIALEAFPAKSGSTSATVYEDDTLTTAYQNGAYRTTHITLAADPATQTVRVVIPSVQGQSFSGAVASHAWTIRLRRPSGWPASLQPAKVFIDGKPSAGWRVLPSSASLGSMPFETDGSARDGSVLEIGLPRSPVNQERTVTVVYSRPTVGTKYAK